MADEDIGKLLDHIMEHEPRVTRRIISIYGIQLRAFDSVEETRKIGVQVKMPAFHEDCAYPQHRSRQWRPTRSPPERVETAGERNQNLYGTQ